MIFQTVNPEIISLYEHYQNIKLLISELETLKKYLMDEGIIKQSNNYIVLQGDKFSYSYSEKFQKVLFKDYINPAQLEVLILLYSQTISYIYDLDEGGLTYNSKIDKSDKFIHSQCKDIIGQFKFGYLYEIKHILKDLIKYKINNIEIAFI